MLAIGDRLIASIYLFYLVFLYASGNYTVSSILPWRCYAYESPGFAEGWGEVHIERNWRFCVCLLIYLPIELSIHLSVCLSLYLSSSFLPSFFPCLYLAISRLDETGHLYSVNVLAENKYLTRACREAQIQEIKNNSEMPLANNNCQIISQV